MKNKIYEIIVRLKVLKAEAEQEYLKFKKKLDKIEKDLYEYDKEVNNEK